MASGWLKTRGVRSCRLNRTNRGPQAIEKTSFSLDFIHSGSMRDSPHEALDVGKAKRYMLAMNRSIVRACLAFAVTITFLSCGPSTQPAIQPAVVAVPAKSDSLPHPVPAAHEQPPTACVVLEQALETRVKLRLFSQSRAVAELGGEPTAKLVLPAGLAIHPPMLEVAKNGVTLWTPYVHEELPLRPRRPIVLRDVVRPRGHRPIQWLSTRGPAVTVRYDLGNSFEPLSIEDQVACDAIGLNVADFDGRSAAGGDCEPGDQHLSIGESVDFSVAPGSEPSLSVTLRPSIDPRVAVRSSISGWSEVCLETTDEILVGWVKNAALSRNPLYLLGRGAGRGGRGGRKGRAASHHNWVRCRHEVALHASVDGQTAEVGKIAPGTPFDNEGRRGEYAIVDFWDSWITPVNDSVFLVETEVLKACR